MTGTASTYAQYACNGLFIIDDTEILIVWTIVSKHYNIKKPTKGHITVDQNLKLDRLSRDPALKGTDTPAKVRKLIDENPTEDRAAKAIVKLQNAIKKAKEAK